MTPEQIRAKREKLKEQYDKVKERLDIIKLKMEFLQRQCKHPKMKHYTDYGGFSNSYCDDCGYDN